MSEYGQVMNCVGAFLQEVQEPKGIFGQFVNPAYYQPGGFFYWPSFVSSSVCEFSAAIFSVVDGGYVFVIKRKLDKCKHHATKVGIWGHFWSLEAEVFWSLFSYFKVLRQAMQATRRGATTDVGVKEMDIVHCMAHAQLEQ
eukprot:TRINITY_DN18072_c0_g1_i1.p4 TRINITY_DN18072_c0_g1~~TRINITY_DN18072_c0_g1_i1.p4  ORF type:complete len:141 (+),score=27.43 TRINITY_DN18072_c0_g1_i1:257-679(+)